jgi:hypothetical protein
MLLTEREGREKNLRPSYLGSQLQQPEMAYQIQPNTASRYGRVFSSPTSLKADHQDGFPLLEEDAKAGDYLIHAMATARKCQGK